MLERDNRRDSRLVRPVEKRKTENLRFSVGYFGGLWYFTQYLCRCFSYLFSVVLVGINAQYVNESFEGFEDFGNLA